MPWKFLLGGGVVGAILSVVAHFNPSVLGISGPLGALVSLICGVLLGRSGPHTAGSIAMNGAIAGGGAALLGILVSFILGDQPAFVMAAGTVGGAVAGAVGGLLGWKLGGNSVKS
jgi:hypothetical protein